MTGPSRPSRDVVAADLTYDAMADAYATEGERNAYNALYERPATLALLGPVAGRDVLDAGCGSGPLAAQLTAAGARVTGFDVSPRMVELARARGLPGAASDVELSQTGDYFATELLHDRWEKGGTTFDVRFWRRPLSAILAALAQAGWRVERLEEPRPLPACRELDPAAWERLTTKPAFLFLRLAPA
jgi:SAM-dependent methyltransferase